MLNVLVENSGFAPARPADAAEWRERFDLDWPVLADEEGAWVETWGNSASATFSQHSYTLIDPQGVVLWHTQENANGDRTLEVLLEAIDEHL